MLIVPALPPTLTMDGIVQQVDAAAGQLCVLVHDVAKLFSVEADCPIRRDGTPLALSDVQVRDRVEVRCTPKPGSLSARAIRVHGVTWRIVRS